MVKEMNDIKKNDAQEDSTHDNYCLVKYLHWESTGKDLDCEKCVMSKCKNKKQNGGEINDQPTD